MAVWDSNSDLVNNDVESNWDAVKDKADLFIAGVFVLALIAVLATGAPGQLGAAIQTNVWLAFRFLFLSPLSLAILAAIFFAERWFPARPEQRGLSPLVAIDALYLIIARPIAVAVIAAVLVPALDTLRPYIGRFAVDTEGLPLIITLVAGVAIGDFFLWFSHMIRHKVPFLWRFHMIHHSQSRLSVFSASRDHPLDTFFETLIMFIPLALVFPSLVEDARALTLYAVGVTWFIRLTHANIRTNFGPLRFLLVTPQSHRIHHSARPEHWNSNYANIFAWDRLFGFQNADDTSYPETGLNHPEFPSPTSYAPTELMTSLVRQMRFPFDTGAVKIATRAPDAGEDKTRWTD